MQQVLTVDYEILNFICNYLRNDFLNSIVVFITHLGDGGVIWILAALFFLRKKQTRIFGISMLSSLLVGFVLGNVIMKPFFARPRPFETYPDIINLINQGGYSFPSGHSLSSFAAAASVYFCARHKNTNLNFAKGSLLFALLIALSRLYVCVHYPTDVLCGSLIGIIIAFITVKIIQWGHLAFSYKEIS